MASPKILTICALFVAASFMSAAEPGKPAAKRPIGINTWLILGPFDNGRDGAGLDSDFIGEAKIRPPEAGGQAAGKVWTLLDDRLFSRNYDDYQDLYSYFKFKRNLPVAHQIVYAGSFIHAPQETQVTLKLGADHEAKVFLNGAVQKLREQKDSVRARVIGEITLQAGWNTLLLKIGNREEGRLGFYAHLEGKTEKLSMTTGSQERLDIGGRSTGKSLRLPGGWRAWPYIEMNMDPYLTPTSMAYQVMSPSLHVPDNIPFATPYRLPATGGKPPYRWTLTKGLLPDGLVLEADGTIKGKVNEFARIGDYPFRAILRDARGASTEGDFNLGIQERPNRWFEQARLVALSHTPEGMPIGGHLEFLKNMKRIGYQVIMPISWFNGDPNLTYYYPSILAPQRADYISDYKKAADAVGLTFGMYMGNFTSPDHNGDNGVITVIEDALRRYHPKVFYFDWAGWSGSSLDAVFSMIKTFDPEIVILRNGLPTIFGGDWDALCMEVIGVSGERQWSYRPIEIPWAKKFPLETWRHLVDPEWSETKGKTENDPALYLRLAISIIGEGFVADLDHSIAYRSGISRRDGSKHRLDSVEDSIFWPCYQQMADWATPEGLPSRVPSFTNVDTAPIAPMTWGYALIDASRRNLYLHLLENGWGKSGIPASKKISFRLPQARVGRPLCLNTNQPVSLRQTGDRVELDLTGIRTDPISTIIRVPLMARLSDEVKAAPADDPPPGSNLALRKPSLLLDATGQTNMPASASCFSNYGNDGSDLSVAVAGNSWAWVYQVDLLKAVSVRETVIHFGAGYATEFLVLGSLDGSHWEQLGGGKGEAQGRYSFRGKGKPCQFIRVQSLKPDGPGQPGSQMQIAELEVYDRDPAH